MSATSLAYISDQDVRSVSTHKGGERFGQPVSTSDGRIYAYGFNNTGSGTALAPGKLCTGATCVANHVNQTGVALAIGTQTFTYTVGATAATAGEYADGYFMVNSGTTVQSLNILNNAATTSAYLIRLELKDQIVLATTTSSKFTLQPNLYASVIVAFTSSSSTVLPVGVPNVSIPDQNYAWFQTGGLCATLINGTPALGSMVIPSASTAGAVDVYTNSSVQQSVGYTTIAGVSTNYYPIYLTLMG